VSLAALYVEHHHTGAPGPTVVIVHGSPDRSRNFRRVIDLLEDVPITVYDRRGYGRSLVAGARGGGIGVHADDLLAVLDGTPAVVVGQSAGGATALTAAAKAPELFLAVGAWEPPMTPYEWWPEQLKAQTRAWAEAPDPYELAEDFNRGMLGDERYDALSDDTRAMLRAEGVAFRADMRSQDARYFELDELTTPSVIGCGADDVTSPFPGLHSQTAAMTSSSLLHVPGAMHGAHTQQPESWAQLVRATVALASDPVSHETPR
jgi:pimeloyl-ACP methyl ester carboxylesterase